MYKVFKNKVQGCSTPLKRKYKQVLGELSRQVSTGLTTGHWAHVDSYRVSKYYERYFAHWLNDMVS